MRRHRLSGLRVYADAAAREGTIGVVLCARRS